jgi:hypothetical protein
LTEAPVSSGPAEQADRRRRVRRTVVLLALLAAAFYIGFIALAITRGAHG